MVALGADTEAALAAACGRRTPRTPGSAPTGCPRHGAGGRTATSEGERLDMQEAVLGKDESAMIASTACGGRRPGLARPEEPRGGVRDELGGAAVAVDAGGLDAQVERAPPARGGEARRRRARGRRRPRGPARRRGRAARGRRRGVVEPAELQAELGDLEDRRDVGRPPGRRARAAVSSAASGCARGAAAISSTLRSTPTSPGSSSAPARRWVSASSAARRRRRVAEVDERRDVVGAQLERPPEGRAGVVVRPRPAAPSPRSRQAAPSSGCEVDEAGEVLRRVVGVERRALERARDGEQPGVGRTVGEPRDRRLARAAELAGLVVRPRAGEDVVGHAFPRSAGPLA